MNLIYLYQDVVAWNNFVGNVLNKEGLQELYINLVKEETTEKKNTSDRKIVGRIIDTTYYITKNVAKDHAVLGAKIFDKVGLTNELEEKVKKKFENTELQNFNEPDVIVLEKSMTVAKNIVIKKQNYCKLYEGNIYILYIKINSETKCKT